MFYVCLDFRLFRGGTGSFRFIIDAFIDRYTCFFGLRTSLSSPPSCITAVVSLYGRLTLGERYQKMQLHVGYVVCILKFEVRTDTEIACVHTS